jgi:glycosyltransferase involved in cell wall biosynthesis
MCPAGQGAGMALYSYKLSNALTDEGIQVSLFVEDQYELDALPAKFNKIKVLSSIDIESNQNRIVRIANIVGTHLCNWHKFCYYVKRDKPAIVHIQSVFYLVEWPIIGRLKRTTDAKLVLTVHDVIPHKFYSRYFGWLELVILKYMYNKADKLIVHAEKNKQQLLAHFSIRKDKVEVIPHGEYSLSSICQEISRGEARSRLGLRKNQKVILFFGYIRKIKGVDILLKAFDRVAESFSDVFLIVAGSVIEGESFSKCRQIMSRMKHKGRVKCFIGYVRHEDVPVFFLPADIVVLPYVEFCAQSGVLHLAQGFGKPVITTNVGGMPEVVEDNETGLIVPPADVERLADAINYLLESEGLRIEMGQRAKKIAKDRYSWKNIAKATIDKVYNLQVTDNRIRP